MKRYFVIILIILMALAGCQNKEDDERVITLDAGQTIEKFENDESFIIYAGTGDCDSCKQYKDVIDKVLDVYDELTVYYIDFSDRDSEELKNLRFNYLYRLEWTPTTYIVVEGKVVSMKEETLEYIELVEWLEKYEFIK